MIRSAIAEKMARKPKENKAIPGQIGGGHRRIACVMDITVMAGLTAHPKR
jgi:hypothetical protein